MSNRYNNKKISEALELLNEAAKEKKNEFYKLIGEKYVYIKDAMSEAAENGCGMVSDAGKSLSKIVSEAVENGQESLRETAAAVDKKVHSNPWPFLGGAAAACFLLGFFIKGKGK